MKRKYRVENNVMASLADFCVSMAVDWTEVREHDAKSGNVKKLLAGCPTDIFWGTWRREETKIKMKSWGITVSAWQKDDAGAWSRGAKKERSWEVLLWLNPKNQGQVALALDFDDVVNSDTADCPF